MTVHKSKGLGFDVVILPDVPAKKIPDLTHYRTVSGDGWITAAPVQWARALVPELREAEEKWAEQQAYEAFCKLYVAMTRAKRGLYIFLDTPAASADDGKASLANWLMVSLGLDGDGKTVHEVGNPDWAGDVAALGPAPDAAGAALGQALAKRSRTTPSGAKATAKAAVAGSAEGRRFGTAIHAAFEAITWLDEGDCPAFPTELRKTMDGVLAVPGIRKLFCREGKLTGLFREQRIEAVQDGKWLSGVIDRLHVHRDADGNATKVEIIDFKTDRVETAEQLKSRYAGQMDAYEKAISAIYPAAEVKGILVSTALKALV
jgi:ATP-dependent exoDNAse (exonuclease V) beta subunit